MVTEEMIKQLPKVELHDHLDGSLRPRTILELAEKEGVQLPAATPEELAAWFHRGADRKSLSLYLEGFAYTTALMQSRESLRRVAREHMHTWRRTTLSTGKYVLPPVCTRSRG